jgi:hypothetical protein
VTNYRINDLLSIATDTNVPVPEYYEVPQLEEHPDVRFVVGDLDGWDAEAAPRRIGSRYRWDPDGTLYLEWNLPLDLRASITGLGDADSQTVVKMTEQYEKRGDIGSLFTSVLAVELLARDATLVHGGCGSRPDGGALITGWDDMGKTSTCLSVHDRGGFSFMGDDAVLLTADGQAHAWDYAVGISPYTSMGNIPMSRKKRLRIVAKRLAKGVPGLGVLHSAREKVDVTGIIGDRRTTCPLETVYFLEGGEAGPREISATEAGRRLAETTTADKEMVTHDAIETYAYLDPTVSGVTAARREVMEAAMSELETVELCSEDKDVYPDWIVETYPEP